MGRRKRNIKVIPQPKIYKNGEYLCTVEVLSYPINVFEVAELGHPETQGEYYPDENEIYIKSDAPSEVAHADRFLHEVVHGISFIALAQEDRLTERQVNTVSMVLVDTLRRNPVLLEAIIGGKN